MEIFYLIQRKKYTKTSDNKGENLNSHWSKKIIFRRNEPSSRTIQIQVLLYAENKQYSPILKLARSQIYLLDCETFAEYWVFKMANPKWPKRKLFRKWFRTKNLRWLFEKCKMVVPRCRANNAFYGEIRYRLHKLVYATSLNQSTLEIWKFIIVDGRWRTNTDIYEQTFSKLSGLFSFISILQFDFFDMCENDVFTKY